MAAENCLCRTFPVRTPAEEILKERPNGLLLTNGPGDPEATAAYLAPFTRSILEAGIPVFGICLGHQILGIALGAKTFKMDYGHHGANHPVKDLSSGRISITSMNHGFALDPESFGEGIQETHVSLFDGTNCGIESRKFPAFGVQFHPEGSPGPHDNVHLFARFAEMARKHRRHAFWRFWRFWR